MAQKILITQGKFIIPFYYNPRYANKYTNELESSPTVTRSMVCKTHIPCLWGMRFCQLCFASSKSGGCLKNAYELINLNALKSSLLNKLHIFQCMCKIFCGEFQRVVLIFYIKCFTHKLKDMTFIQCWKFKSSWTYELVCIFETPPTYHLYSDCTCCMRQIICDQLYILQAMFIPKFTENLYISTLSDISRQLK